MNILVAGGAGYIGSHCVRQLSLAGHRAVVVDNLVFGHRKAIEEGVPFYRCDLCDETRIGEILDREEINLVMHFAAFAYVGESVSDPLKYYFNNVVATLHLLRTMERHGVRKFVFSSTCATYGIPSSLPITEQTAQIPINPYGQTKLDVENILKSLAVAHGLSSASFRYFNAAGAADNGIIGEDHTPETHLIPLVIDVALGKRGDIRVFGSDYPTPDGTCLRDYIHVDDLSRAHISVFEKLNEPGQALFYNLGTGSPTSVKEVIAGVERITGKKIPVVFEGRREGDPPSLYADSRKAQSELGWKIEYPEIEFIIETAWRWHKNNPSGFSS